MNGGWQEREGAGAAERAGLMVGAEVTTDNGGNPGNPGKASGATTVLNRPGFLGGSIPWKEGWRYMATKEPPKHPASRRYSDLEKEQAVRLVRQLRKELGTDQGTVDRVARRLGYGEDSVRSWVRQADTDEGKRPGCEEQFGIGTAQPGPVPGDQDH